MPNPFLEGAPYNQMIRISKFTEECHRLTNEDKNSTVSLNEEFQLLEDAFFDSCVATQACVVKAIASLRIFDDYPAQRVQDFLIRVNEDTQAVFISDLIDRLATINTITFGSKA